MFEIFAGKLRQKLMQRDLFIGKDHRRANGIVEENIQPNRVQR